MALVGYGLAGRVFHAPLIEAASGTELAAIVTSDPDRRAQALAAHPGAVLFEDAGALWAATAALGVELAVVATPNRSHLPVALAALGAGLGVVIDKPLAATVEDGRRIVAEAGRRGLFLSVFHNRRWDGDFLTVRRLIGAGELGRVWRFESRYERWRPNRKPDAWRERADPTDAGGLLADLGSHLIDQAIVLFGPPVSVYAELHRRRPGTEVDDDTFIALDHKGGMTSHLWASSVASRPGPRFRVLGSTAGYVVWGMDPQERALLAGVSPRHAGWGESAPGHWGTIGAGEDDGAPVPTELGNYERFYEGVVASMRGGHPPPVTPADAVTTLEVIAAARSSAALGRPVIVS